MKEWIKEIYYLLNKTELEQRTEYPMTECPKSRHDSNKCPQKYTG